MKKEEIHNGMKTKRKLAFLVSEATAEYKICKYKHNTQTEMEFRLFMYVKRAFNNKSNEGYKMKAAKEGPRCRVRCVPWD